MVMMLEDDDAWWWKLLDGPINLNLVSLN